jgi:hypothetical protein
VQKYVSVEHGSPYARLKLLGYYAQRLCTSRRVRKLAGGVTIAALRAVHGRTVHKQALDSALVDTMRMQGCVRFGKLLSPQQCSDMRDYLRPREMVAVRGSGARFTMDKVPDGMRMGDYPLETIVNCPHVMELANNADVLALASRYLGYTPTITLISLRWSFPGESADADVQSFHRDSEAGSIKLLVYLTDVDHDSGPHRYVAGSHRDRMPLRLHRYSDCEVHLRHGGSNAFIGPAGTALAIDSKGIHKGTPPVRGARLLLGVQYSLLPCLMYEYAPVMYRGRGRFSPYINRLMLQPGLCQEAWDSVPETLDALPE